MISQVPPKSKTVPDMTAVVAQNNWASQGRHGRESSAGTRPYRPHEVYCCECECGKEVESTTREAVCGECGLAIRMEWGCVVKVMDWSNGKRLLEGKS